MTALPGRCEIVTVTVRIKCIESERNDVLIVLLHIVFRFSCGKLSLLSGRVYIEMFLCVGS